MDNNKMIQNSLLKLAAGYDYEEREVNYDKDGKGKNGKVTKKHVPPSIEAIKIIEQMKETGEWEE